jgi:hypothetical protein
VKNQKKFGVCKDNSHFIEMKNGFGMPIIVDKEECESVVRKCANKFHAWQVDQAAELKKAIHVYEVDNLFSA